MTYRPEYTLTIECPRCQESLDVTFTERGRYTFAPEIAPCDFCGYHDEAELTRLAWDASDREGERREQAELSDA